MPRRDTPFISQEIYHVFNRGVAHRPIFKNVYDYLRFLKLIDFYRFKKPPLRFSHYNRLNKNDKKTFIDNLYEKNEKLVDIYAFCLMPNHFHFLVYQKLKDGIPSFLRNLQNAYARYFNTKYKRSGSLFQLMFKGVRIETDEQLTHVQRYIHLNPLTSYILKNPRALREYRWSSFGCYSKSLNYQFVKTGFILKMFDGDRKRLIKFALDQADYQRELDKIQHLTFD